MSTSHLTKLKRKATELEQKKQFEKALALYIQFVDEAGKDIDDADLQLFNRVGDLLTRQGSVSEALAYYEKAVDVYAERGFLNNAIALCNKILRQSPARTSIYYKLGRISASKGFKSDARKNFLEYADRLQKAGQREESLRALKEFADLCPDQDDIRLMLAEMLSRDSRSSEAIEQLEQLYSKQQAEGRAAEARATADRIKAIDPEATPRSTGAFQAVKNNDLVFLDLGEPVVSARAATPTTPVAPLPVVESVDVSGVAALSGLTITFLPDESEPPPVPREARLTPIAGLETTVEEAAAAQGPIDALAGLERVDDVPADVVVDGIDVEAGTFEAPAEEIAPVSGLSAVAVPLSDSTADPSGESGGPFEDDMVLVGDETSGPLGQLPSLEASLELPPDLAGDTNIPPLLEETPDEWVHAALAAPRADFRLDHLLTPLNVPAIAPPDDVDFLIVTPSSGVEIELPVLEEDVQVLGESVASIEALLTPVDAEAGNFEPLDSSPLAPTFGDDGSGAHDGDHTTHGVLAPEFEVPEALLDAAPVPLVHDSVADAEPPSIPSEMTEWVGDPPEASEFEPAVTAVESGAVAPVADTAEAEALPDGGPPSDEMAAVTAALEEMEALPLDLAFTPPDLAEVDAQAPDRDGDDEAPTATTWLDTSSLRDAWESNTGSALGSATPARDELLQAAFDEERVELPLLDLESDAIRSSTPDFVAKSEELDALLSTPATFEGEGGAAFEPPPLDLAAEAEVPASTEEWVRPEVLIDGEWRHEQVGDLVSGEMFVIGERRPVDVPEPPPPAFDDLAAAMLYAPQGPDGQRAPTPSGVEGFNVRATPRSTLSFGGMEAQLRRRLELNPDDFGLRRQLAEALLDLGDREGGLNELEAVVSHFEAINKLDEANEVVNVILQVVPLSVRHHQKRVEYAARSGNRGRLVDAYTELGDALFRCGEPDKARVVYSRVVELAPDNERARFAIGMLSGSPGTPRQSDEIPAIEAGVLGGVPSLTMAMLTPDSVEELPALSAPASPDALAEEVDAAFSASGSGDLRRRTSELQAVEEWASTAPAEPVVPEAASDYVDLGDWLRGETEPRSTRMVAADVAPSGDEAADFAEMLRRFKTGVDEHVEVDDYASQYDLGVAYKEMGLLDEAIGQFQRALRGPNHRIPSYEALGQCFVEKGQYEVALALLQRAAETPGADEFSLVGVLYHLGFASEQVGRTADAVRYFHRVFAVDIAFRDVAARLAALERSTQ